MKTSKPAHNRPTTFYAVLLLLVVFLAPLTPEVLGNPPPVKDGMELVEVHWLSEMRQGGMTMVALGLLSVALLAFTVERSLMLRRKFIVPPGLVHEVLPLFPQGRYEEIIAICQRNKSILGDVIIHLVAQRHDELAVLNQGAGDLGARELNRQEQRNLPFGVIATLAPLLGLLGTMIGMIESFKLVEVFGDEGGASMLAGSISKALITTAGGLVLAVPAVILFNVFKFRLNEYGAKLEESVETLINVWFKAPVEAAAVADAGYAQEVGYAEEAVPTYDAEAAGQGEPAIDPEPDTA